MLGIKSVTTVLPRLLIAILVPIQLTNSALADVRAPVQSLFEMRRSNLVMQEFDLSCGAAVVATILAFQHGDPVSERDIAVSLMSRAEYVANPSIVNARQGFSLFDLKGYVEQRGYTAAGFGNLSIEDLIELAPIIVPVDFSGYHHFVVFRGVYRGRVLIGDPAWGNRTMKTDQFERAWLDYAELGKIGLTITRSGAETNNNQLTARPRDFLILS